MDYFNDLENAMTHLSTTGAFLTTKDNDIVNTMTISWGFVGFMWGKPYFITMVRPQRFTNEILSQSTNFTVSIPFGAMKEELKVCGTKSGKDINKHEVVSFIPAKTVSAPVVEGCTMYYECEIKYTDTLKEGSIPDEIISSLYNKDYHDLFFGEIVNVYRK